MSLAELDRATRPGSIEQLLWRGLYPRVAAGGVPPGAWYADYMATYVERDVRQLVNVRDLGAFRRFVRMCAARTAQLVNLSSLAADCGVTHNTAKAWLSVLEASYIVRLVAPFHRNFGKRLIKAPKLFFLDTGLAASLIGIREARDLATHAMRGALFETWVAGGLRALEVKSGRTIAADWLDGLEHFARVSGSGEGMLIYGGDQTQQRSRATIYRWRDVAVAAQRLLGLPRAASSPRMRRS